MIHFLPVDRRHAWPILSQYPNIANPRYKQIAENNFLPALVHVWQEIERLTGYQWQCTSYWRKSPSHERGEAIDLAPAIATHMRHAYAVYRGSDPVLYKRTKLVRALQRFAEHYRPPRYSIGIYIEPDHLHIQLMNEPGPPQVRLFKWKQPKLVYGDTLTRMMLPMM